MLPAVPCERRDAPTIKAVRQRLAPANFQRRRLRVTSRTSFRVHRQRGGQHFAYHRMAFDSPYVHKANTVGQSTTVSRVST
jgi:hypothetical protein